MDKFETDMKNVLEFLKYSSYPAKSTKNEKRSIRKRSESFTVNNDGFLMTVKGTRVVSNSEERLRLTRLVHESTDSHLGRDKTVQKLTSLYFWKGIWKDVDNFIKKCQNCRECLKVPKNEAKELKSQTHEQNRSVNYGAWPPDIAPLVTLQIEVESCDGSPEKVIEDESMDDITDHTKSDADVGGGRKGGKRKRPQETFSDNHAESAKAVSDLSNEVATNDQTMGGSSKRYDPRRNSSTTASSPSLLLKHEASPKEEKLYPCKLCKKSFDTCEGRRLHARSHSMKPFPCKICNKRFSRHVDRRNHELAHAEKFHECQRCHAVYKIRGKFQQHKCTDVVLRSVPNRSVRQKCIYCSKVFKSEDCLEKHLKAHKKQIAWNCEFCNLTFRDAVSCLEHRSTHRPDDMYQCKYCSRKFHSRGERNMHHRYHRLGKPHPCKHCGVRFSSKAAHKLHEKIHVGEMSYRCQFCEEVYTSCVEWETHEKSHQLYGNNFHCDHCSKAFRSNSALETHKRLHQRGLPFLCHHCGITFLTKSKCNEHFKTKHGSSRYNCNICHVGFGFSFPSLSTGKVKSRTKERPFKCTHCSKIYSTARDLKEHVWSHTGESPHKCTYCSKAFFNAILQRRHEERYHINPQVKKVKERPTCETCGSSHESMSALRRHNRIHTGEKPYECNFCGRAFREGGDRKKHERIHTGEKPFQCSYCDKRFRVTGERNSHEKSNHEKPKLNLTCKLCGKKYQVPRFLEAHEASHLVKKEKPVFVCCFCGKLFSATHSLKRHELAHLGEKPYQCQFCLRSFHRKDYLDDHVSKSCPSRISGKE